MKEFLVLFLYAMRGHAHQFKGDNLNPYMKLNWYDLLIIHGFTFRSRIFHLHGDVTITGVGLQNLGLCSALRAFEHGGIFIVPHLL
jgi:hypothetical protein